MTHELRQVRAFLKVAELQSFTRAAVQLHVSQSALTVQIKQLEEELGVLLFDRNKRGVTITAAGRDLLGPLERLVSDSEAIVGYARDMSAVRTGTVSIAALPTVAADVLPRAVHRFLQRHPDIRVTVHDVVADRVVELVVKRAVDLGLGTARTRDREIASTPLYQDSLAAFVPHGHALAGRNDLSLRELLSYDLIVPNRESSVRRIVEAAFTRERISVAIRHETNYIPTALGMVRFGLGVAILPESSANWSCSDVVRIPIVKPAMSRQICLLQRRDQTLSPAAAKFAQALRAQISHKQA